MGVEVERTEFSDEEYARFGERLEDSLEALRELLARPGFGVGDTTIGAELELFLVDRHGRPLPENQAVLDHAAEPRLTLEIDRFNLELNPTPLTLECRPFSVLGRELTELLQVVRAAAGARDGREAMIGILPTLRGGDLRRSCITDAPRYQALDTALRRLRQEPLRVTITGNGPEPVELERDDVALEGANTSFQVHLRVDPERYSATYNAGQLATAPVLAVAGNSPIFLGRQLWEETRVALFEQAVEDRDEQARGRRVPRVAFGIGWARAGALGLFEESVRLHEPLIPVLSDEDPRALVAEGGVPTLAELRLHQGTVWRWNRAIYDPASGGHLRIELRALPAGPTVVDMLANAAFLIGLTLALASEAGAWTRTFPFPRAHANFYKAARHGLDAELEWPNAAGHPEPVGAVELAGRLVPVARGALVAAGVDAGEADRLLGVIAGRAAARQTGAVWQRRTLSALEPRLGRRRALTELLRRYMELSADGQPVHTWPLDDA